MIPGEYILKQEPIECNKSRETISLIVVNKGDRPIQVGSHFHFFESNRELEFNREKAFGKRLNIAAGTAVRFEPGEENNVELVNFGGNRHLFGFNNLVNGDTTSIDIKMKALEKMAANNFKDCNHELNNK
jgi:urease subunit beta